MLDILETNLEVEQREFERIMGVVQLYSHGHASHIHIMLALHTISYMNDNNDNKSNCIVQQQKLVRRLK